MKSSKSEMIFLFLTIVVVGLSAATYMVFGHQKAPVTSQQTSPSTTNTASSVATAEESVKSLEDNQTQDNLTLAQGAVSALTDAASKARLQARIDAVSLELTNQASANASVAAAEASPNTTTITNAQAAIDAVGNSSVKASLQARLDALNTDSVATTVIQGDTDTATASVSVAQ
ncbi:hypothetical protein [Streptococcus saliviloxodontae]|uniref:Peptidase n=1 Tax=Streptococcus saliviloxodontae TaxID=1349416 RepID=A0ABS2PMS8_9STRE|nr:hypothetical protein [Streptococcus saliviloxodontae]MBM7636744.1 hypothetical protein [Streptococcus saliviloxodontae]